MRNLLYIALCVMVSCKSKEQIQAVNVSNASIDSACATPCDMPIGHECIIVHSSIRNKYAVRYTPKDTWRSDFGDLLMYVNWANSGEYTFFRQIGDSVCMFDDSCSAKVAFKEYLLNTTYDDFK